MTHEFKNVSMFLFGAMFFLVACQNDAVQEIVNENVSLEIASKETLILPKYRWMTPKELLTFLTGQAMTVVP